MELVSLSFPTLRTASIHEKSSCKVSQLRRFSMFRSAHDFGAAIRETRKALGWTQTEFATRSGTDERFVVELETGKPR
jgi:ribosome-binding protein aMBF1 (putative translation factor)